jgi:hypothetical protein
MPTKTGRSLTALRQAALTAVVLLTVFNCFTLAKVAQRSVGVRRMADFAIFYRSAQLAWNRQNPYQPARDSATAQRLPAPNLNLPHAILLMMPLAIFTSRTALIIWLSASALSAVYAVRTIFREAGIQATPTAIAVAMFSLSSAAATGAFLMSFQLAWLLWAPVTWAWALARRGRWHAAGAVLGVVASIKPFMALFVPVLLVSGRRRAAAMCVTAAAGATFIGIAALGWPVFLAWLQGVRSVSWTGHIFNASTFGYFDRVFGRGLSGVWALAPVAHRPQLALTLGILAALVVLGISLSMLRSGVRDHEPASATEVDRLFGITLAASLLATPLGWIYYQFVVAGPFVALLSNQAWRRSLKWRAIVLAVGVICLSLSPRLVSAGQPSAWATASLGSSYFWGLVALWCCALTPVAQQSGRARSC